MELPTTDRDPSGLFGLAVTFAGSVLALLVAFGVELTEEQIAAILGVGTAGGPLLTAWLIRRKAWAPETHRREVEKAYEAGRNDNRYDDRL